MISFIIFFIWIWLSVGSLLLWLYYIQDLPTNLKILTQLDIQLSVPNLGSDMNLWIGLLLTILFPLLLFITWKFYRKLLVNEIRNGFWIYMAKTLLQSLSFYILYKVTNFYFDFGMPVQIWVTYLIIFFIFIRIWWFQDYHGKKRFFRF